MSSFTLIKKYMSHEVEFPTNTIRVRASGGIALAPNVSQRFATHFYTTRKDAQAVKLNIEVDKEAGKIRLSADKAGFSFKVSDSGIAALTAAPKDLMVVGMPVGDYLSKNNGNTFTLVK